MAAKLNDEAAPLEERCGALVGLAFESDDPIVRARMLEFYEIPESRAKALEAMWRSLDRSFAEFMPQHLADPDPEIKRNAIWGTGYLGIGTEAGKLREFFDEEDLPQRRIVCVCALGSGRNFEGTNSRIAAQDRGSCRVV